MWKWLGWVLLSIGVLAGIFCVFMLPISFYLPHQKPVIILPFDPQYDSNCALMPMGEKIAHPDAPSGHPGIDFGFSEVTKNVPYIASMDGTISKIKIYPNRELKGQGGKEPLSINEADVVIRNGPYQTVYSEMDADSLPAYIKRGAKISQGDFIGYGNFTTGVKPGTKREMIHWEFGSISPLIDRFCPLTYFTVESETRIEKIWVQTDWPEMKALYPNICNGDYDGKAEK